MPFFCSPQHTLAGTSARGKFPMEGDRISQVRAELTRLFDEQKALPSVRGTVTFVSINPAGIGTGCLNSASDAMDSIRKRLVPSSVHCWSGSVGQRISFRDGIRTRLTKGCQSPLIPSEATGRKRSGPNAEGPDCLSGSRIANTL